jgi:hypothetical protein
MRQATDRLLLPASCLAYSSALKISMFPRIVGFFPKYTALQASHLRENLKSKRNVLQTKRNETPWLLIRKRTIPTERPPLVSKASVSFCGWRVSRGQRNESLRPLISVFKTEAATFPIKELLNYPHEAEWTPFQTHYFSENLVAPGIEPCICS